MQHRFGAPRLEPSNQITVTSVFIGDRKAPFKWIEVDPDIVNAEYIAGISFDYHRFKHRSFVTQLDSKNGHHALNAMRQNHLELCEYLCALLCAFIQAPNAVGFWLTRYRNNHLDALAEDLYSATINPRVDLSAGVFKDLPALAQAIYTDPDEQQGFLDLTHHILDNYLGDGQRAEYGALKHSDRTYSGAFEARSLNATMKARTAVHYIASVDKASPTERFAVIEYYSRPIALKPYLTEIETTYTWGAELLGFIKAYTAGHAYVPGNRFKPEQVSKVVTWGGKNVGVIGNMPLFEIGGQALTEARDFKTPDERFDFDID